MAANRRRDYGAPVRVLMKSRPWAAPTSFEKPSVK